MKKLLTVLLMLLAVNLYSQVVINEVMYAPTSPAKEWFEIYNTSNTPVSLQNWKWKDAATSNPFRTVTTLSISLGANSFAIICEDSANFKSTFPGVTGLILQSSGWNALNNTGNESIVLQNGTSVLIDSLGYTNTWGGGTGGFSLEKINPAGATNQQSNWGTSIDPLKATPNRQNSLTPKQNDLMLKSFAISPLQPSVGDSLKLDFVIKNIGLLAANNYTLNIYKDLNFDSIAVPSELLTSQPFIIALNQNDSLSYRYNIANIDSGRKQYIGILVYAPDQDTLNNKLIRSVNVGGQSVTSGLLINEIMYAPTSPEPEWVEVYNNSGAPLNIKNWKISDESGQGLPVTITTGDRIINTNDYLVIAKSNAIVPLHPLMDTTKVIYVSGLPTFNNDVDKVIIYNNASVVVDQVMYHSSWGGSSRNSLERISFTRPSQDSTNWMTSLDCENSTPTRLNSFGSVVVGNRNDLVINEIMFDPLTISSEYIEFYNNSGKYLNLNGWKATVGSSSLNLFNGCKFYIQPGAYLILASDTTLYNRFGNMRGVDSTRIVIFNSSLGLSNSGAMIKISDVLNNTIDSVYYSPKWHNNNLSDTKGYSLERINIGLPTTLPSNWSSCANPLGGTPGQKNSIFIQNNKESSLSVSPNPFSPDGDGYEDFTIIKYKLKANTSQIRVKIFDVKGRIVRSLSNNQFTNSESQIIFDGKDDGGQKLRVGIYVVFLEAVDDMGGTYEQVKTTLVVAAKL
ncbi:MAG: lamin tail domain-containing protein [Ignavibacteria bacterium]